MSIRRGTAPELAGRLHPARQSCSASSGRGVDHRPDPAAEALRRGMAAAKISSSVSPPLPARLPDTNPRRAWLRPRRPGLAPHRREARARRPGRAGRGSAFHRRSLYHSLTGLGFSSVGRTAQGLPDFSSARSCACADVDGVLSARAPVLYLRKRSGRPHARAEGTATRAEGRPSTSAQAHSGA